jgi:hypothetical protein
MRVGGIDNEGAVMSDEQTVAVSASALRAVLVALNGPGHYIRELQVTRGPLFDNPIDTLLTQYNEQVETK